ncbi:MAG: hypothetical protein JXR68_09720 [Bacteroidales bacterium]|nr:hypothetical protein [Bacteroidales bacterium]
MKKIILLTTVIFVSQFAIAQNIAGKLNFKQNRVTLATGMDYSMLPTTIKYDRGFNFFNFKNPIEVGTEITIPVFDFDFMDNRLKINMKTDLWNNNNFFVHIKISPELVNSTLKTQTFKTISTEFELSPGYANENWYFGLEASYNYGFATYITHNQIFRDLIYQNVVDGWYKSSVSNIKLGFTALCSVKKIDFYLSAGILKTGKFNNFLFVPSMYGILGISYNF